MLREGGRGGGGEDGDGGRKTRQRAPATISEFSPFFTPRNLSLSTSISANHSPQKKIVSGTIYGVITQLFVLFLGKQFRRQLGREKS